MSVASIDNSASATIIFGQFTACSRGGPQSTQSRFIRDRGRVVDITSSASPALADDAIGCATPPAANNAGGIETALEPGPRSAEEVAFYQSYRWCLNPHLTVVDAIAHLRDELAKLAERPNGWQAEEVATNVFLLSSGLLNCVDEYLRGRAVRLPGRLTATPIGRGANHLIEMFSTCPGSLYRARLRRWRREWLSGILEFLSAVVVRRPLDPPLPLAEASQALMSRLPLQLPRDLRAQRLGVPSPFNRLDLTQRDVLALGECFVECCPDRSQPILLLGLRTSGSYFAPLLQAFLEGAGFRTLSLLTIEPKKGPGRQEARELRNFARRGYGAVIVDDPPDSAGSVLAAFDIARRAGFAQNKLTVLVPTHPSSRNWHKSLPGELAVSLPPERWHKQALLEPAVAQERLAEYYRAGDLAVRVVASRDAETMNLGRQQMSADERGTRLKRIYEVELQTPQGERRTQFVLAKSVGWGWFGYAAFLAARGLGGLVPPMLGLRDGILYMEWLPQRSPGPGEDEERELLVEAGARYVATRVRHLGLETASVAGMDLARYSNAAVLLEKALSRAYGPFPGDALARSGVGRSLRQQPCPLPTLIDGNMRRSEWIFGPRGPLKTDYEHHGMGKAALNVTDPAYDLADAILNLELSSSQQSRLIQHYIDQSGDAEVGERLFINKLLAGIWAMNQAQQQIRDASGGDAQQRCHRDFMRAWNFLTVETARYCGSLCRPRTEARWRAPLIVLDIDGVLDRRVFGFPATTNAGVEALSLLRADGHCVAVNTARSVSEVRDYCEAYSLAGGVAEHGSYIWDAVSRRGRALISPEAIQQLDALRCSLRRIPGVFLDERHQYSIRAFTYQDRPSGLLASLMKSVRSADVGDGAVAPLPNLVVRQLLADLRLDRLSLLRTTIDSTIIAKESDKGTGLLALRDWVLGADAETVAVGDSATDLPMFRVATRSFAPAQIGCAREARLLGCLICERPYQRGLLEIARMLVHSDGRSATRRGRSDMSSQRRNGPFMDALRAADRRSITNLLTALLDRHAYRILMR
jgi:hydroxymethylpyrimidine pyrophosphatase-like HAD family hydrolase